jgi:uncharacterized protein DUF2397
VQAGSPGQEPPELVDHRHGGDGTTAARLLGDDRDQAFLEGAAPLLAGAAGGNVIHILTGERVGFYLNILFGMLILRRGHELEPLHEDLYHHVRVPQALLDARYDLDGFAQDLAQLVAWGAIERMAEAMKIRGYRDNRRQRFRYRLTDDAVALLEWLESRLAERLEGRTRDSRDRLADVLGQLKELLRLLDAWRKDERKEERKDERKDERTEDSARRAFHLAAALDDATHAISDELLGFRATMLGFAARPYELAALRGILGWLERYVRLYLLRIEELRREVAERLGLLAQPRYRRALAECRELLLRELMATPRELRRGGALRRADDLVDAQLPFFAEGGGLVVLCTKIDDSARAVLRKMHRHLRELEQRSARLADLRARVRELASLPPFPLEEPRLADFVNALVAAAHARFDRAAARAGERRTPPVPRSHATQAPPTAHPPLRAKARTPDDVRELRARREAELRRWLHQGILAESPSRLLSQASPTARDAPRRWLDVARARHLGGGRALSRLGAVISAHPGEARLGDAIVGLLAPDALVQRGPEPQRARGAPAAGRSGEKEAP